MNDKIVIRGARENNLKNVNRTIPRDKLIVFTGLSGSGKSSLAFDTIYAEVAPNIRPDIVEEDMLSVIGKMKNGVIKDPKIHKNVVITLINFIKEMGLYVNDLTYSTQKGKSGNIEYLALVSRNENCKKFNIDNIIQESHKM